MSDVMDQAVIGMSYEMAMGDELSKRQFYSRAQAILAERDELRADNEELRKDSENWKTVMSAMEQLKADERGAAIWSACSRILISVAHDLNSSRSVVNDEGVTKDGLEIGDWRVTVERISMDKEGSANE